MKQTSNKEVLLSCPQIAKKIGNGTTTMQVYHHIQSQIFCSDEALFCSLNHELIEPVLKQRTWFTMTGSRYMLRAQYFDEYKTIFEQRDQKPKISHSKKARNYWGDLEIPTGNDAETLNQKAQLSSFIDLCKKGVQAPDLKTNIKKRQQLQKAIALETNDEKIAELTSMLATINEEIRVKRQITDEQTKKFEAAQTLLDKQEKAHAAKSAAEQALHQAENSLAEINRNIMVFLMNIEQKSK